MNHSFPFDPTYGYDLDGLLRVGCPPEPADFASFWHNTYAQTLAVELHLSKRLIHSTDHLDIYEIEYDGLGGFRVGGWMTIPHDRPPVRGLVVGHGYGGREAPSLDMPGPPAIAIFPCARGFHRSARPANAIEPTDQGEQGEQGWGVDESSAVDHSVLPGHSARHVRFGIASRQTYLHRFCVADLWSAASVIAAEDPHLAGRIHYYGASFGGGIGAMALPWDRRFTRAFLDVPSFGDHPLRVTLPCTGSGESIRRLYARRPEILDVMAYFDAALAAKRTTIPVYVSAAVFDPAVPPPGQFAVYNALAGPKQLFVRAASHFTWDGESAETRQIHHALADFYAEDPALG